MPLKLCLIGAGHMGRIHASKLSGMKGVSLACVVDADSACAEATANKCGVSWSCTHEEPLSDGVEGAVIASTTESHFSVARDFLKKGVHVFIEKPIASTLAEASELIQLAKSTGLVLQIGHLERFSPPFRKARPLVKSPFLIEAWRVSPFSGRSTDIDVIHDMMIHDIDLALALNSSGIKGITARGTPVLTEKVDVAHARIEFADGCVASLSASRVSLTRERLFRIVDKERYFSLDLATGKMFSCRRVPKAGERNITFKAAHSDPVGEELKAFVKAIRGEKEEIVDGEAGLRALQVADSITAQIEKGSAEPRA